MKIPNKAFQQIRFSTSLTSHVYASWFENPEGRKLMKKIERETVNQKCREKLKQNKHNMIYSEKRQSFQFVCVCVWVKSVYSF